MDKQKLYEWKDKEGSYVPYVYQVEKFLNDLLGKRLILPTIVGHTQESDKQGEIEKLKPLNNLTKLTIQKYVEGIKQFSNNTSKEIYGSIKYNGLNDSSYDSYGFPILEVSIGDSKKLQTFDLKLIYESDKKANKGYLAYSRINKTDLEGKCKDFVGPNTDKWCMK